MILGGFELHEDTSATEMVDRLLAMLNQYLISHKHLQLDRSFKVYIKILSSGHSAQKSLQNSQKGTSRKDLVGFMLEEDGINQLSFRSYGGSMLTLWMN